MTIEEIYEQFQILLDNWGPIGALGVILIVSFIEIAPVKINPWTILKTFIRKLLTAFGDIINYSVIIKIDQVEGDVTKLRSELTKLESKIHSIEIKDDERDAILTRNRILAFGDDLMHGILHSKDSYDQTLMDIESYDIYCKEHPEFKNHITVHHAKLIETRYMEHLENNDFLQ